MHKARRNITRAAWRLAKCYWTSEEKGSAWVLLVGVLALNLGNVYISVRINEWNRSFYSALQAFDSGALFSQLGNFCILVFFAISMSGYGLYLTQMLQIRWRRWLTGRYLDSWLAEQAYYKLGLGDRTDNPDQRITEDLNQFLSDHEAPKAPKLVYLGLRASGGDLSGRRNFASLLSQADRVGRSDAGG